MSPQGGRSSYIVTASAAACAWTARGPSGCVPRPERRHRSGGLLVPRAGSARPPDHGDHRRPDVGVAEPGRGRRRMPTASSMDGRRSSGWTPATADGAPGGDADGDGVTNLAEQAAGTHPRGTLTRYLAEGAGNAFFDTEVALFNPDMTPAHVLLRIQPEGGDEVAWPVLLPGQTRRTLSAPLLESLTVGAFSTLIESDVPVSRIVRCAGMPPATAPMPRVRSWRPPPRGISPRARRRAASSSSTCCRIPARRPRRRPCASCAPRRRRRSRGATRSRLAHA